MERVTHRLSTYIVSTNGTTEVYGSMKEVPPEHRQKLLAATSGPLSGTILIADERGREEIAKALEGAPTPLRSRFIDSLARKHQRRLGADRWRSRIRAVAEIALVGGIGLCLWLLASMKQ
jgi:hypothetical protein